MSLHFRHFATIQGLVGNEKKMAEWFLYPETYRKP